MDADSNIVFPMDIEAKLRRILVEDIDSRLKEVTSLVALQETELALLWVALGCAVVYLIGKEYRVKRERNSRSTI